MAAPILSDALMASKIFLVKSKVVVNQDFVKVFVKSTTADFVITVVLKESMLPLVLSGLIPVDINVLPVMDPPLS